MNIRGFSPFTVRNVAIIIEKKKRMDILVTGTILRDENVLAHLIITKPYEMGATVTSKRS